MIAHRLKLRRIEKNYSQDYIAHKLGITQKAYSKIEAGSTELTVKRLIQIASILDLCVAEIFLTPPALDPDASAA